MRPRLLPPLLLSLLASPVFSGPTALAAPAGDGITQDDDDFLDDLLDDDDFDDIDDGADILGPEDDEEEEEEEEKDEFADDDDDFLDGDDDAFDEEIQAGQDTAELYRQAQNRGKKLNAEDEIILWEEYLEQYPYSVFEERIEARIDELTSSIYTDRIDEPGGGGVDALRQELDFAIPLLLENIDPRSKLRAGFEWGFPEYFNLLADLEYQILRELSAHAGLRRRYVGWNAEVGGKYALIKSARTNTLLTGILDLHLNMDPVFPAVRPQLGFGQRINLGGGIDLQLQGGADIEFWSEDPSTNRPGGPQIHYIGGGNITYNASELVGIFVESSTNIKPGGDVGLYRFNIFTFGMRFVPGKKTPAHVALSANVPYATNYYGYHYGAVQGDLNYYLDN